MASGGASVERRADIGYGEFKIKLVSMLDKPTIRRLALYLDFPPAERHRIANDPDPGLGFVDHIEGKGLMTSYDVSKLIEALEKIDRKGVADDLLRLFPVPKTVVNEQLQKRQHDPSRRGPHGGLESSEGELGAFPRLALTDSPPSSDVMVPEEPESVVSIGINKYGWRACDIVCVNEDRVVITGKVPKERHTFITLVDRKGKMLRLNKILTEKESERRVSLRCSVFSQDKIAILCHTGRIGFYDTLSGSYTMKSISRLTEGWPSDQHVSCIATDPQTKDIFVGSSRSSDHDSREVFRFDRNLKHRRTLKLPANVHGSWDMAFHRSNLLICDAISENILDVNVEGPSSDVLVFEKPLLDLRLYPCCVCSGSGDFAYALWHYFERKTGEVACILTQHNTVDGQLLNFITVDSNASALCAVVTKDGEKLLVVTETTGKLYQFGLFKV